MRRCGTTILALSSSPQSPFPPLTATLTPQLTPQLIFFPPFSSSTPSHLIPLVPTTNLQTKLMNLHLPHLPKRRNPVVTDGKFLSYLNNTTAVFLSSPELVLCPSSRASPFPSSRPLKPRPCSRFDLWPRDTAVFDGAALFPFFPHLKPAPCSRFSGFRPQETTDLDWTPRHRQSKLISCWYRAHLQHSLSPAAHFQSPIYTKFLLIPSFQIFVYNYNRHLLSEHPWLCLDKSR
jgi:hypothetical protein